MERIVIVSDLQIPAHDPRVVYNLIGFIKRYKPDRVVSIGDDGEYYLQTLHDDKKPVWQHKALLNEGLDDLAAEIEEANHETDDY